MEIEEKPPGWRGQDRQRKLVLLLAPLLVILLVIQGPKLVGALNGGGDSADTATPDTPEVDTAVVDGTPDTGLDLGAATATAAPGVKRITHSDLPPRADQSELTQLTRFKERDPFVPKIDGTLGGAAADESDEGSSAESNGAGVSTTTSTASTGSSTSGTSTGSSTGTSTGSSTGTSTESSTGESSGSGSSSGGSSSGGSTAPPPDASPDPDAGVASKNSVEIQVNGSPATVRVGDAFPQFDPVFRLVAVAGDTVRIGLVRGAYSTGAPEVDLQRGETRTLVSQPDGTRYRLRLVSVG